jgi:acetyl-CoA carboxylase biotin carboxylase subunit
LREVRIEGVPTTVGLHLSLLADQGVRSGQYDTNYLERWIENRSANKS